MPSIGGINPAALARAPSFPRVPVIPPSGFIFTDVKAPLQTSFDATSFGSRVGRAHTFYVRIPIPNYDISFAFEDASIAKAARKGDITQVKHVDYEMFQVLGLFGKYTTVVYGD